MGTFQDEIGKVNNQVGTGDYLSNDPYRHSLALMELIQTLLQMGIEIGDHIKARGATDKSQASYNRIQRLLKLTFNLDTIGDMNVNLLAALRQSRGENIVLQQKMNYLEKQLEASRKAFEEADNNEV